MLEAEARRRIDGSAVDVACDLLCSPWPCLGILVARGVAPLAEPWDRETLLEEVGLARDRLTWRSTRRMTRRILGLAEERRSAPTGARQSRQSARRRPERVLADKEASRRGCVGAVRFHCSSRSGWRAEPPAAAHPGGGDALRRGSCVAALKCE
jgi:hypothetical protein